MGYPLKARLLDVTTNKFILPQNGFLRKYFHRYCAEKFENSLWRCYGVLGYH